MRQMGCAYRKARLSDAQKLFVKGKRGKSAVLLAREFFRKKHPKFYILHFTLYIYARERAGADNECREAAWRAGSLPVILSERSESKDL